MSAPETERPHPPAPPPDEGDATVLRAGPATPADGDPTVLRAGPPAPPEGDATVLRAGPPTPADGDATVMRTSPPAPAAGFATVVAGDEPLPSAANPTQRTIGRYQLLQAVGAGGMGVVWKAWDPELRRTVALKEIREPERGGKAALDRFLREARIAGRLSHPGIVSVYEAGASEGRRFLAMAFIEGRPLTELLRDSQDPKRRGDPLDLAGLRDEVRLLADVAQALGYAHGEGVMHRDLKPGNVIVDRDGRPHVIDFGLAKDLDPDLSSTQTAQTLSGAVLGTPAYMSPEQAGGRANEIGPAADVYALGVLLYEILTGRTPFEATTAGEMILAVLTREPVRPRQHRPAVPPELEAVCLKALEKEPRARYPSARQFEDELRRWLQGEPVRARPLGPLRRAIVWIRRHRAVALLIAGAAAVAFLQLFVAIDAWTRPAWLRVRVHPADARVAVSGVPVDAEGEVRLVEVAPGTHFVQVEREGWVATVLTEHGLARNETREVVVNLERETGTLVIEVDPPQAVEVDTAAGVIPYFNLKTRRIELRLPTGRHEIAVGREDYFRQRLVVDVGHDQTVERRVRLRKAVLWRHTALDWGHHRIAGDLDGDGIADLLGRSFREIVTVSGRTGRLGLHETVPSPGNSYGEAIDADGDGACEWVTCRIGPEGKPELVALAVRRSDRLVPLWSTPVDGIMTARRYREQRGDRIRFELRNHELVEADPEPGKSMEDEISRGMGAYADVSMIRTEGDLDGDGVTDLIVLFEAGELRAFSTRTGARLWSCALPEPAWRMFPHPAQDERARLVVSSDRHVWSLDRRTGEKSWEVAFARPPWLGPVPTKDGLVVGVGAEIVRLREDSGREGARYALQPESDSAHPVVRRGDLLLQETVPVRAGGAPRRVDAWDLASGKRVWSHALDLDVDGACPVEVGGRSRLVGVSPDGARMVMIDAPTGALCWSSPLPAPLVHWTWRDASAPGAPPSLLACAGAWVIQIDLATGDPQWKVGLPATVRSIQAHPELLVATEAGHVVALDSGGQELFSAQVGQPVNGLAVLHADGDGLPDILVTLPNGSAVVRAPKLLWRRKVERQVRSQPVLHDVNGDGIPDAIVPLLGIDADWRVVALDGRDGSTLWEERHLHDMLRPVAVADLDGDGRAEVVTWHKDAHALRLLDARTGRPAGEVAMPAFGYADPAVADLDGDGAPDVVALGWYEGAAYAAMSGRTRGLLWQGRSEMPAWSGATFGDADGDGAPEVFFVTQAGGVESLRGRTGERRWHAQVGGGGEPTKAGVALGRFAPGEGLVAVVSAGDRRLHVFDAATGRLERSVPDVGGTPSRPAFADVDGDGILEILVGGVDGLACLDRHGERRWFVRSDRITGDPVVADLEGDGRPEVVFGTCGGRVCCLVARDGELRWVWEVALDDEPVTAESAKQARDAVEGTVALADVDGDGVLDVFVPSHNGSISCITGRGTMRR